MQKRWMNVWRSANGAIHLGNAVPSRGESVSLVRSATFQEAEGVRLAGRVAVTLKPYLSPAEREFLKGSHAGRH